MRKIKVISGGQTGVDQTALVVAKGFGMETGGAVPRGCRTEKGPASWLISDYHCHEDISSGYLHRTIANVINSDGTVLFGDMRSAGSKQTISACLDRKKPFIENPSVDELDGFIRENDLKVVNFAGNRFSVNPQAVVDCAMTLIRLFVKWKDEDENQP